MLGKNYTRNGGNEAANLYYFPKNQNQKVKDTLCIKKHIYLADS